MGNNAHYWENVVHVPSETPFGRVSCRCPNATEAPGALMCYLAGFFSDARSIQP